MRALFTSASGMMAQQMNLDIISNDLANVNTTGYKRTNAHFQDLLYQNLQAPGAVTGSGQLPTGMQVGLGVNGGSTMRIFTQGTIQQTGNDYDLAIKGDGFFRVLTPDGIAYTRDGSFSLDSQGRLVTSEGYPVQPEIIIPTDQTSITISQDGKVSVTRAGQNTSDEIGTIQLTRFINPSGLLAEGSNMFKPTPASGDAIDGEPNTNGYGAVIQKSIETANVEVVEEMIKMITIQRAYETNSKSVQAADEMLQGANNLKR